MSAHLDEIAKRKACFESHRFLKQVMSERNLGPAAPSGVVSTARPTTLNKSWSIENSIASRKQANEQKQKSSKITTNLFKFNCPSTIIEAIFSSTYYYYIS